ncbi:hypothetical protein Pcinc_002991 [Petrolisthes cinctipes]|uniref:Uncharacterized protein n=1 Tax=Petrolisthes cinctipes TaxID=88211 RepID=A0AAE1GHK1_PETCI|nr:hypothetical protein Pcinc_002991 [Petrolisthes cinctipes]
MPRKRQPSLGRLTPAARRKRRQREDETEEEQTARQEAVRQQQSVSRSLETEQERRESVCILLVESHQNACTSSPRCLTIFYCP